MSRKRGRPRKGIMIAVQETSPAEQLPAEIEVRMGHRPCMTSRGPSDHGNPIHHGVVVSLPRHEAENLLSLGYASHV